MGSNDGRQRALAWWRRPAARRMMRLAIGALLVALIVLGGFCWWAYRAVGRVPEFYAAARATAPKLLRARSRKLQAKVEKLQAPSSDDHWELELSQAEINGYLATRVAQDAGEAWPDEVEAPAVLLMPGTVWFAVRLKTESFDTVLNVATEPRLLQADHALQLDILEVYAGDLPIPLRTFRRRLDRALRQTRLGVQWSELEDRVRLVVKLPELRDARGRGYRVEALTVHRGHIVLRGRYVPSGASGAAIPFRPSGR